MDRRGFLRALLPLPLIPATLSGKDLLLLPHDPLDDAAARVAKVLPGEELLMFVNTNVVNPDDVLEWAEHGGRGLKGTIFFCEGDPKEAVAIWARRGDIGTARRV